VAYPEPGLARRLWRALILRCPRCRHGPIFDRGFDVFDVCPNCDLRLNREPGYYVGGMEINAGVTCLVAIGLGVLASEAGGWSGPWAIGMAGAVAVGFPFLFYRHARSLWICIDRALDPDDHWWEPPDA
jgi:hypothetical protein